MSDSEDQRNVVKGIQSEEPFLSRWARLKKASREGAAQGPVSAPVPDPAEAEVQASTRAEPASTEPEADAANNAPDSPEPLDLPPLESLTGESDFSAFMRPGVDPGLRRQALRKLFQNPKYAVVDELDPFRADFAAFTPLGDIITADMKFHAERLLRKQLEEAPEAEEADDSSMADTQLAAGDDPDEAPGDIAAADRSEGRDVAVGAGSNNDREDDDEHRNS